VSDRSSNAFKKDLQSMRLYVTREIEAVTKKRDRALGNPSGAVAACWFGGELEALHRVLQQIDREP
jgi:hypothetical protein